MKTKLRTDIPEEELFLLKIKYGTNLVDVFQIQETDYSYFEKINQGSLLYTSKSITLQIRELIDFGSFDGLAWQRTLRYIPELSDYCDWDKLRGEDWVCLLREQPQFAEKCDWSKLKGENWVWLLRAQPQFVVFCN